MSQTSRVVWVLKAGVVTLIWLCCQPLGPLRAEPAFPGDLPDPSILRVGREYWATATSSEWGPEFPLFRSTDLRRWQPAGAVFPGAPPAWAAGNFWAPEISTTSGRFRVYFTARKKDGPLCVAVATADGPAGPYVDRGPLVCQPAGSIDAFPIRDEDGRPYLIWKEDGNSQGRPTPLWAQPLSADGAALLGQPRELLRNDAPWEGPLIEAPSVLRRGGWFYLFFSANTCCGRDCRYGLGVARARRLLGPWEKYAQNPILASNESWRCPGHGTVTTDPQGRTFLLYHAYDRRGSVHVGRQMRLDEVRWDRAGWPVINRAQGPSGAAPAAPAFYDDFSAPPAQRGWQWPVSAPPPLALERPAAGREAALRLGPAPSEDLLAAVLARPAPSADYVATAALDLSSLAPGAAAGLSAYGDADNALGIVATRGQVTAWRREKGAQKTLATAQVIAPVGSVLYLRLVARAGDLLQLAFSTDGQTFTALGNEQDGAYLPPWDRGVRVALTAGGAGGRFRWFRVTPREVAP